MEYANLENKNMRAKGYPALITNMNNVVDNHYVYDPTANPLIVATDIDWCGAMIDGNETNSTDDLLDIINSTVNIAKTQEQELSNFKQQYDEEKTVLTAGFNDCHDDIVAINNRLDNIVIPEGGGTQGLQGPTGAQGPVGMQGATGVPGMQGTTGVRGMQGATGTRGQIGAQGSTGVRGMQGPTGAQGPVGAPGNMGMQGATGIRGLQGLTGSFGAQGRTGAFGIQGRTGAQGVAGTFEMSVLNNYALKTSVATLTSIVETKADADNVYTKTESDERFQQSGEYVPVEDYNALLNKVNTLENYVNVFIHDREAQMDELVNNMNADNKELVIETPMESIVVPETSTAYTITAPLTDNSTVDLTSAKYMTLYNTSEEPVSTTISHTPVDGETTTATTVYLVGDFDTLTLKNISPAVKSGNDAATVNNVVIPEDNEKNLTLALNFNDGATITNNSNTNITITDKNDESTVLSIVAPNSTVTLNGGTFETLNAEVSDNTLIIKKNAHVSFLNVNKGNVIVEVPRESAITDIVEHYAIVDGYSIDYLHDEIDSTNIGNLQKEGTHTLISDITKSGNFAPGMFASDDIVWNLNGHNITFNNTRGYGNFLLRGTVHLEINGEGNVINESNEYGFWTSTVGSKVVINGGNFEAGTHVLYAQKGTIEVNGGTFKLTDAATADKDQNGNFKFLLNCHDAEYTSGEAQIIVRGGKFYGFNPAESYGEPNGPVNFVAEGYKSVPTNEVYEYGDGQRGTVYEVVKEEEQTPEVEEDFFCKLTLDDDSVVNIEGSGKLTSSMTSDYKANVVHAEIGTLCNNIWNGAFSDCSKLTSVNIANTVTNFEVAVFRNSANLTSIIIPDSVTHVGAQCFMGCENLTQVQLSNNLTEISDSMFRECTHLSSITIPSSITTIGDFAFLNCENLTSVVIPDSVTTIGESAFYNCSGLTSITLGNNVTFIGESAFYGCVELNSIIIPDSVTTIDAGAFRECNKLTSITIPNNVSVINSSLFSRCENLETITLGSGVTNIGPGVINECSHLNTIICNAMTAPTIETSTFKGVINSNGTLIVPIGSTNYDSWMSEDNLGAFNWTKVEQ